MKHNLFIFLISTLIWALIALPVKSQQAPDRSISEFLDENGYFHNPEGYTGSLDISGYDLNKNRNSVPVFTPLGNGNENWTVESLEPGVNGPVIALAVSGDNLYLGGSFTEDFGDIFLAGGQNANYIVRYNITNGTWHELGELSGSVESLAVSGNNLYVGGFFFSADGQALNYIARYEMSSGTWHPLGDGLNSPARAIEISGDYLYAGGEFTTAGGQVANYAARYNLSTGEWQPLGDGVDGWVWSLAVSGDDLYVGGDFTSAGGQVANHIARYNLSTDEWHALGDGLIGSETPPFPRVYALTVAGSNLYVGGRFTEADGLVVNSIARYNISSGSWHTMGSGVSMLGATVKDLVVSGDDLFVGGAFFFAGGQAASRIARYNISSGSWHALGDGIDGGVETFAIYGNTLYVGGSFFEAGGAPATNIASWSGLSGDQTLSALIPGPSEGWHLLGAPIPAATYGGLLDGVWTQGFPDADFEGGASNVYWFQESNRSNLWNVPAGASNIVGSGQNSGADESGRGFLAWIFEDDFYDGTSTNWPKVLSVTGIPPDGDVTLTLSRTTGWGDNFEGWHLLANPYPFTIDWALVHSDQSDINASIYVWDKNRSGGADYIVSGSGGDFDGLIAPFQGFWVRALSDGTSFIFRPEHQASSGAELYTQPPDIPVVTLNLDNGDRQTWTSLLFDEQMSGVPDKYNAARMAGLSSDYLHMFTRQPKQGQTPLQIQYLPQFSEESITVPLHTDASASSLMTLSASDWWIPEGISLHLVDSMNGKSVELNEGFEYHFEFEQPDADKLSTRKDGPEWLAANMEQFLSGSKSQINEPRFFVEIKFAADLDLPDTFPEHYALHQNYPNPFNPTTQIEYALPEAADVQLEVFNMMGQRVATLVSSSQNAGHHTRSPTP